ncbi:MAG: DoxX family protein [Candidatus Marinimicrobia bacterium]|nr:DoxX family protein [Candidatus Neomarinimicrobiota bacterium]|tara:strand:- start:33 stop:494 length:462 start_codon:yes stop_codon:yes gene_type:complete
MLNLKKHKVFNFLIKKELYPNSFDWGILMLRVIPSFYMFYYHGMRKISSTGSWEWLGEAAMSLVGINFGFTFFGFLAAFSEGILTWFVMLGFFTRLSSIFLMITMFFASIHHLVEGETAELALIYFTIYIVLFIFGPGKYSLDKKILNKESNS